MVLQDLKSMGNNTRKVIELNFPVLQLEKFSQTKTAINRPVMYLNY